MSAASTNWRVTSVVGTPQAVKLILWLIVSPRVATCQRLGVGVVQDVSRESHKTLTLTSMVIGEISAGYVSDVTSSVKV